MLRNFHHREHRVRRDGWEGKKGSDPDPKPFPAGLCALCALCGETLDPAGNRPVPLRRERLYLLALGQRYLLQVPLALGEIQELNLLGLQAEHLRVF